MTPEELERIVHARLRALPSPRAPRSLRPAVMAAVRARAARPWYARPWHSWPSGWQAVSAVVLVLAVVAVVLLLPDVVAGSGFVATAGDRAMGAIRVAGALGQAAYLVTRAVVESVGDALTVLFLVMLAAVTTVAAAIRRVALGGAY